MVPSPDSALALNAHVSPDDFDDFDDFDADDSGVTRSIVSLKKIRKLSMEANVCRSKIQFWALFKAAGGHLVRTDQGGAPLVGGRLLARNDYALKP